ncbi:C1 family peptidase [uncultured Bacteroides sp.]|uniref:C1 family peptidase n=1 Tax=uncultured Bacteroides sp. TaxID=162156 RepID=UPI0025E6047A|nr:C1 family peptidase [uncultured Bacteroides sp.]
MKKLFMSVAAIIFAVASFAQTPGYEFTTVVSHQATPVKDQASTGTCWCFATTSFMESELLRMGKGEYDLSEMFIVRQKYMNQMEDNYLRRGKGNIGEGSLAHTFKNAYKQVGIVPEEAYTGLLNGAQDHNHGALTRYFKALVDANIASKKRTPQYYELINNLFDIYLGKLPETFTYKGKEYTPKSFTESLGLNMDDYIELTSFTHKPYYEMFSPEVPDNWENQPMYNLPLDELIETMDYVLNNGYTVCWDGDVSEQGFSFKDGIAINPQVEDVKDYSTTDRARFEKMPKYQRLDEVFKFEHPYPEVDVTPEVRQEGYEKFVTTDDHLMHVTGITKDQNGTKYYITKNSWGAESNKFGGYLNMSESYVRAKTICIMVHKDSLPKELKKKLGIL